MRQLSSRHRIHTWRPFQSKPAVRSIGRSLLVTLLFCTAAPAVAGTHWHYAVIGFSSDGKYAALEQSGMVDGVGLPDCFVELYDLDVNKKIDLPAAALTGAEPKMHTCAEARNEAGSALENYGIDEVRQGSRLTLQSLPAGPVPAEPTTITSMGLTFKTRPCLLKLYEKSDQGQNPWGRSMIKWNVGVSCGGEPERMVLSEEWSAFSVRIKEARSIGDRLVLFPSTAYQDFEEPGSSTGVMGIVINQAPAAGVKLDLEVLGFSDDEQYFGYWLSGADPRAKKNRAELHLFSTKNNEEVLKESETGPENSDPREILGKLKKRSEAKLAELKLGYDPGAEMYKSGTATKTLFKVAESGEHQLRLKVDKTSGSIDEPTELVLRRPNKTEISLFSSSVGFRYSLNTVRLSKRRESLAVVLKYSLIEGGLENRAYTVSFTPITK